MAIVSFSVNSGTEWEDEYANTSGKKLPFSKHITNSKWKMTTLSNSGTKNPQKYSSIKEQN